MPLYEYQCRACGHEYEALQKLNAEPLSRCPSCSQPELMKKISAAGFRLKGGGWYETDFKSGVKKNVAGEAGSAPAPPPSNPAPAGCGNGGCGNC